VSARRDRRRRGFSLVEVMVAMAILALLMAGLSTSSGDSMARSVEVMNLTRAVQLIDAVVLDIEEEYRLEGFPTNQLTGRACEVPREFRQFRCEYDLFYLDAGGGGASSLGSEAHASMTGSPLMQAFCSGGPQGNQPVDPAMALANLQAAGQQLPSAMSAFAALLDPNFTRVCGINLGAMCSNTANITSFIPLIIEQAAASTRKLVVRISWGEGERSGEQLAIETFITAVPAAEAIEGQNP
jgi:prepilin-type N-terminal cleavage/methylation domain-containing protein